MSVKSCRVTIRDVEGVEHSVQVTATTLYEAVALALRSVRGKEWVSGLAEGNNMVRVTVTDTPVEHSVRLQDFNTWLKGEGGTPRDRAGRYRIREILGLV
jgi:hypothetical protein